MDNRMLTAEGLKNLFWGEIIAICAVIPLLGTIAGIVGMVLSILGFVKLSRVSSLHQIQADTLQLLRRSLAHIVNNCQSQQRRCNLERRTEEAAVYDCINTGNYQIADFKGKCHLIQG